MEWSKFNPVPPIDANARMLRVNISRLLLLRARIDAAEASEDPKVRESAPKRENAIRMEFSLRLELRGYLSLHEKSDPNNDAQIQSLYAQLAPAGPKHPWAQIPPIPDALDHEAKALNHQIGDLEDFRMRVDAEIVTRVPAFHRGDAVNEALRREYCILRAMESYLRRARNQETSPHKTAADALHLTLKNRHGHRSL